MSLSRFNILIVAVLFLASCASAPIHPAAVVGPQPADERAGYLQVFSPVEEREDWDRPVYFRRHTGYSVTSPDGRVLEDLSNIAYTSQEDTLELVKLPPGEYWVKTKGKHIMVHVLIKPGRTTVVHLDGRWQPPADVPKDNLVLLPNGEIIGWRADTPETSKGSKKTD